MLYPFTKEEVKLGDRCLLVWYASKLGEPVDDAPKGKKVETVFGKTHMGARESIIIPVQVTSITKEWVRCRLYYKNKNGKFEFIYTKGQAEPVSLEFINDNKEFNRLIKFDWCVGLDDTSFLEKVDNG